MLEYTCCYIEVLVVGGSLELELTLSQIAPKGTLKQSRYQSFSGGGGMPVGNMQWPCYSSTHLHIQAGLR